MNVVMDTNVAIVANGQADHADDDCSLNCVRELNRIRKECCLVMDCNGDIFKEYKTYLSMSGEPGAGDAFFKWFLENQGNENRCLWVMINDNHDRVYQEFPDDPELADFDRSDRKFVAVARAATTDDESSPTILNASDTDWWYHREGLKAHGINITFLCPQLMPPEER